MRKLVVFASALALMAVALLAALVAPLDPVNTLQLVEAASRQYSFPYLDGNRRHLTLRTDYVGVCIDRQADWGERENSVDTVRHTPGVVQEADILSRVSAGSNDLILVAYPVEAMGPAIANLRAARGVYSINLVFEPSVEWALDVHVSYLEPVRAAHIIYSNALHNEREPIFQRPFAIEPTLIPLTEDPDNVAPGPVVEETRITAMILTNYFHVTVDHKENVPRVIEAILAHGGAIGGRQLEQHDQVLLSCSIAPRGRALGYNTLDLIRFAEATGHVVHALPGLQYFRETYYRRASGAEIAEQLAEQQKPAMTLEEIEQREYERRYPDIPPQTPYYTYGMPNQTTSFWLEGHRIALWFADDTTETETSQVLADYPELAYLEEQSSEQDWGFSLIALSSPLDDAPMRNLCERLSAEDSIAHVSPLFLTESGEPCAIADVVFFTVPIDMSFEEIRRVSEPMGMGIEELTEHVSLGYQRVHLRSLTSTNAFHILEVSRHVRDALALNSVGVGTRTLRSWLYSTPAPDDEKYSSQWNLQKINCLPAWQTTTGDSRVEIAVIDTGIDQDHPDLMGRFINGFHVGGTSDDWHGHGTNSAGIAVAMTNNNGEGIAGVTWDGSLVNVRVSSSVNWAPEDVVDGFEWAISNNCDLLNMSGGSSSTIQDFDSVRYAAYKKGLLIVAGMANDGLPAPSYPASYPTVVGIGSTDQNDAWAGSNTHPSLDIAAPGVGIWTTERTGTYAVYSGTSLATPHVSGVAALILAATLDAQGNKTLDGHDVHAILRFSADDLGATGDDDLTGYGRLNAEKAIEVALSKRLIIRDKDGKRVLWFDQFGNMMIYGRVRHSVDQSILDILAEGAPFVLRKGAVPRVVLSRGADPLVDTVWTLYLGGTFAQRLASVQAQTTPKALIVASRHNNTNVALIDENGNLKLTGYVFQAYEPDALPQAL